MTETLACGYSSDSTHRELSNEYQYDRVKMVFKNLCVFVLWMKVALALEGLKPTLILSSCLICKLGEIAAIFKLEIWGFPFLPGNSTTDPCFRQVSSQHWPDFDPYYNPAVAHAHRDRTILGIASF